MTHYFIAIFGIARIFYSSFFPLIWVLVSYFKLNFYVVLCVGLISWFDTHSHSCIMSTFCLLELSLFIGYGFELASRLIGKWISSLVGTHFLFYVILLGWMGGFISWDKLRVVFFEKLILSHLDLKFWRLIIIFPT